MHCNTVWHFHCTHMDKPISFRQLGWSGAALLNKVLLVDQLWVWYLSIWWMRIYSSYVYKCFLNPVGRWRCNLKGQFTQKKKLFCHTCLHILFKIWICWKNKASPIDIYCLNKNTILIFLQNIKRHVLGNVSIIILWMSVRFQPFLYNVSQWGPKKFGPHWLPLNDQKHFLFFNISFSTKSA